MPSVLSLSAANSALTAMLTGTRYLAAFTADPTVTAVLANEVAGGGYRRQPITFSVGANRSSASTNAQTFTGMPACKVTHLAVFTDISGDVMVFSIQLATPIPVLESGQLLCAAGDIAISL